MIIPDVVLIQSSSLGRALICSKHVEDSNKHTIVETVRQFSYLPGLYKFYVVFLFIIHVILPVPVPARSKA